MLVVGLTGGIGSGKSTVAELFSKLGVPVTDTDQIAHQLTAPGQPVLKEITDVFGAELLTADGSLDRAALRARVFSDEHARHELEGMLHPKIREAVVASIARFASTSTSYQIIVVPLLIETGAYQHIIQRTLVVDCPEEMQVQRVMHRGKLDEAAVRAIMAAQCSREQRLAQADDVICNDNGLESLSKKVAELHKKYIALA
jgi:dephospho-CoA kinase